MKTVKVIAYNRKKNFAKNHIIAYPLHLPLACEVIGLKRKYTKPGSELLSSFSLHSHGFEEVLLRLGHAMCDN